VGGVQPGSAAAAAGLETGDRILAVGGSRIDRFEDLSRVVIMRPGEVMSIRWERGGAVSEAKARIGERVERDRFGNEFRGGLLGVERPPAVVDDVSLGGAVAGAVGLTGHVVSTTVQGIGQIITGKRSVKELGGPLKIAKFSGEQASLGWIAFVWFVAVISINLGFINLLPIPMLDGGHLLLYLVEGVRRKPLKPEAQEWAFRTGLAALLALMVFVTFNDLASFGLWSKLGGLIG
jgi:regulator of sigma E protease